MFIAFLVIACVMSLILLSVVLLTPPATVKHYGRKISFGEFLSGNLSGNNFNGTWISGEEISADANLDRLELFKTIQL